MPRPQSRNQLIAGVIWLLFGGALLFRAVSNGGVWSWAHAMALLVPGGVLVYLSFQKDAEGEGDESPD